MQDGKHFRLARHPVMAQKLHDHLGKITPVDLLCKLRRVTLLSISQCLHNKRTYNVNYVIICTGIIKHIHIVIKTTPEAISILISYLCHIVCKACSVTTITVCTLIHNNNIMYNNIDCKSVIWLTGNDHGPWSRVLVLEYEQNPVCCTFGQTTRHRRFQKLCGRRLVLFSLQRFYELSPCPKNS